MSKRKKKYNVSVNTLIIGPNDYKFFLTNAFGRGKEHYALQICEDVKNWTFLVLTHTPSGHYRLKKDPLTGNDSMQASFLNTSLRTKPKSTRLREDKTRKLSKEDETYLKNLLKKKALK